MTTITTWQKWAGVAATGALIATAFGVTGGSSAATATKTINTTCTSPAGNQKQAMALNVTAPDNAKVGQAVTPTVQFNQVLPAAAIQQLAGLGANGLDMTGTFNNTWAGAATGAATGEMAIKGFALPATGDGMIQGTITFGAVTPTAAGTLTMDAGAATINLTPTKDGAKTAIGTVALNCTVDAGQDVALVNVPVA